VRGIVNAIRLVRKKMSMIVEKVGGVIFPACLSRLGRTCLHDHVSGNAKISRAIQLAVEALLFG
jgi:hypothetical protein